MQIMLKVFKVLVFFLIAIQDVLLYSQKYTPPEPEISVDNFASVDNIRNSTPYSSSRENFVLDVNTWDNQMFDRSRNGEFLVDTTVTYHHRYSYQKIPAVAFDGSNYLIAWEDMDFPPWLIQGTMVNQDGNPVFGAIAMPPSSANQADPALAYGGSYYLMAWVDGRYDGNGDIFGARIDTLGNVLDSIGFPISTAFLGQNDPAVSFDGTNYYIVWTDMRHNNAPNIYAARVDQNGILLDYQGVGISTHGGGFNVARDPAIAYDSTNFLVVWEDRRSVHSDIYGARIDGSCCIIDSNGIAIAATLGDQCKPAVAFDGENYMVIYQDGPDIFCKRINTEGAIIDTAGIVVAPTPYTQLVPSISYNNGQYFAAWYDYRTYEAEIRGARILPTGEVLDQNGIAISDTNYAHEAFLRVAIASGSENSMVVWTNDDYYIYGSRIDQMGTVLDTCGFYVPCEANWHDLAAAAFDGTNYLVVWEDKRGENRYIYGMRIDQNGTILDTQPIRMSGHQFEQRYPSVSFNGTDYFVVWQDARNLDLDIYGTRVTQSGIVLDPEGIPVAVEPGEQTDPYVSFDGTNYLIVWAAYEAGVHGRRVDQSGNILDITSIPIAVNSSHHAHYHHPTIAVGGSLCLVTWGQALCLGDTDLYGCRVDCAGNVLDPLPFVISHMWGYEERSSTAFDGQRFLIAWTDDRGYPSRDIYCTLVDTSGYVLDTSGICVSWSGVINWFSTPAVAFDGTDYRVIWADYINGRMCDLYGAKVTTSGTVIDTHAVSVLSYDQTAPFLVNGPADSLLLIFSSWTTYVNAHLICNSRIWGTFQPYVGIEESSEYKAQSAERHLMVYPNPFLRQTTIQYDINYDGCDRNDITLHIFDVSGRLVKQWHDLGSRNSNQIIWDGSDDCGKQVPSGVYFVHLHEDDHDVTRKVLMLR